MKQTLWLLLILTNSAAIGLAPTSTAHAEESSELATLTLRIKGMVSRACPVLVTAAVKKLEGVKQVEASFEDRSATVVYEPRKISSAAIRRVIKDQVGFDSDVVK